MNLVELYQTTPVEEHNNIRVSGNRAYVKKDDGSIEEYVLGDDGELWPLPSPLSEVAAKISKMEKDLSEVKLKLGVK